MGAVALNVTPLVAIGWVLHQQTVLVAAHVVGLPRVPAPSPREAPGTSGVRPDEVVLAGRVTSAGVEPMLSDGGQGCR